MNHVNNADSRKNKIIIIINYKLYQFTLFNDIYKIYNIQ